MILILRKKIHFRENWLIFWGILGEAELFLGIWGAKTKNFLGAEEIIFQGFWEINALFSGIKGAQTPLWASLKFYNIKTGQWYGVGLI